MNYSLAILSVYLGIGTLVGYVIDREEMKAESPYDDLSYLPIPLEAVRKLMLVCGALVGVPVFVFGVVKVASDQITTAYRIRRALKTIRVALQKIENAGGLEKAPTCLVIKTLASTEVLDACRFLKMIREKRNHEHTDSRTGPTIAAS